MTKRLIQKCALAFLCLALASVAGARMAEAQTANLIANPSVENTTSSGTSPANWLSNRWGTSAAVFSYLSSGAQDGSRAVRTVLSGHQSGDAKWYSIPVAVQPNTDYIFSDYYRSDAPTRMVAVSYDSAGTPTYYDVANVPASPTTWTQHSALVRTRANTQTLTVFHVIAGNGTLDLDNASLTLAPVAPQTTIVPNPSMEIAAVGNPNAPANWAGSKWGTNTAVWQYLTGSSQNGNAQNGSKFLRVQVSNYQSGDVRWTFTPQTLTNGSTYTYKIWYKGTVSPHVVARYERANGQEFFHGLTEPAPATSSWQLYTGTFTVPSDAVKASAYMFVTQNGTLDIDNASIELVGGNQPLLIPNPSLETVQAGNSSLPAGWHHGGWGTSTKTYEYLSSGAHQGSRSVKVTVSNYVDGDASWGFDPQTTYVAGQDYKLKAWYKSNVMPHIVARYERADGSEYFYGLPDPLSFSQTTWQEYSGVFHVPADAVKVSAYMFIIGNGWLQTDNYSITPYTYAPFNRGLVTLVFDDGYEENVSTVLPVLDQYGWKSTLCAATQFIEGNASQVSKIQAYASAGHEICSHTVTHPDLTTLNSTQLAYELNHAQTFLQSITGQSIANFSSPFGAYNATVNAAIAQNHASHRTTDEGYNSADNFDRYRLRVQNMQQTTTLAEFQTWVNKAKNDKLWLILVYHVVSSNPTEQFDTIQSDFNAQMAWLSNAGTTVKKWNEAMAEIIPQLP